MKKKLAIGLALAIIIVILLILYSLAIGNQADKENTDNIIVNGDSIVLSSMTLQQKIAQMIMIRGDDEENIGLTDLNIGGIFLDRQNTQEDYSERIESYQEKSKIQLLVATDLEGTWNPFSDFMEFSRTKDIENSTEALKFGEEHGKLLKSMGFNVNFAPVAEQKDYTYDGRAFTGDKKEIISKISAYIQGLQENVFGVCKHYPGKGLIKNLHLKADRQNISKGDLELFNACFDNNITGVMVGHQAAEGEMYSDGGPSSTSKEVIGNIPENFLVISDEVNMQGLRVFYPDKREMYRGLINSGNNLILDFSLDKNSAYKLILGLEEDVRDGKIDEERINGSVKKILKLKGYEVV